MIVLILAALIALVARVDAAGAADEDAAGVDEDAIELAIRYADALTGIASDPARAPTLDGFEAFAEDRDDPKAMHRTDRRPDNDDDDEDEDDENGEDDRDDDQAAAQRASAGDTAVAIEIDRDSQNVEPDDAEGERLAMLDAELDPGDTTAGADAVVAAAPAGAAEMYEQSLRRQRPSAWGRLDVGVSLRRRWSEPMHAPASRRDELWLVATWRR